MKKNDLTKINLSHKDDLLIQSYFTIAFLTELKNLNFLDSEPYKILPFQDKFIQDSLPTIGIDNRGALLIFLYALLVLPKEQYKFTALEKKLNDIDKKIKPLVYKEISNYARDIKNNKLNIQYIYHIRNSIAHGKIQFNNNLVIFKDINTRVKKGLPNEECQIEIPQANIGKIIHELQFVIIEYLKSKN